jgi:hypothetical protein
MFARLNKVKVYDTGSNGMDRYTAVIGKDMYALSSDPLSVRGVNQYSGEIGKGWHEKELKTQLGKRIPLNKIPTQVKIAIKQRLR